MRRYHFHVYGPNRCVPDREGACLNDMVVLRDLAIATARNMVGNGVAPEHQRRWRVEVTDQDGRVALIVPLQSAVVVPKRPERKPRTTRPFGRPRLVTRRART